MAWIWDKGDTSISIGTEDDDGLLKRARNGGLPQRWKSFFERPFWEQSYGYDYDRKGIPVPLPTMLKGEDCEIKFMVAWSTEAGYLNEGNVLEMPAAVVLGTCHCR